MSKRLLIYGSYGYTGKLIAEECLRRGLAPLLAGRNEHALKKQADALGLSFVCFPLDMAASVADVLHANKVDAVLHCAGPFVHTAGIMVDACLQSQTHYLDITGEFEVIEQIARKNEPAKEAGIVMLPGAGFDVVPSDCMARFAYETLPSAELLKLHLLIKGHFSAGSAATAIEHFSKGSASRKNGLITSTRTASKTSKVYFGKQLCKTSLIPWGDISSAFHSTGISNIEVFMALPRMARISLKFSRVLRLFMMFGPIRRLFQRLMRRKGEGPGKQARRQGKTYILAEVFSINREYASILLTAPEAYTLTARTAAEAGIRIMNGEVETGFQTPSLAFGSGFIMEFEGVSRRITATKGL